MRTTCPTHLAFLGVITLIMFEEVDTVNPSQNNRPSNREWIPEIHQHEVGV